MNIMHVRKDNVFQGKNSCENFTIPKRVGFLQLKCNFGKNTIQ